MKSLRAMIALPVLTLTLASSAVGGKETPLEKQMSTIDKGYKLLAAQERKGSYDFKALAKAFADAKTASEAAAKLVPTKIAKMEEGPAKKKAGEAYRKQIAKLTTELVTMHALCEAKDAGKLKAAHARLKKLKQAGHDEFVDDDD